MTLIAYPHMHLYRTIPLGILASPLTFLGFTVLYTFTTLKFRIVFSTLHFFNFKDSDYRYQI